METVVARLKDYCDGMGFWTQHDQRASEWYLSLSCCELKWLLGSSAVVAIEERTRLLRHRGSK
jgi:hypothetical protein